MKHNLCSICKCRVADKTNSHLIPSFLTCMVGSVDTKYRRGKEILYTIGEHVTTVHIGQEVLPEQLEECFDELSEVRISDLAKTDLAVDYVFCAHCEKKLGEYLESPYSNHINNSKKISGDEGLFFWISVLWRISYYNILHFKLPTYLEASFGKRLKNYIDKRDADENNDCVLEKTPFNYRIVHCKGYSENGAGFIYGEYNKKSKTATFVFGDIVVCLDFREKGLGKNYNFYGIEEYIAKAPINNGSILEQMLEVEKDVFDSFNTSIVTMMQRKRLKSDREMVMQFWTMLRQKYAPKLPPRPCENFIHVAIQSIYDNDAKTGEKMTHTNYARAMGIAFNKVYGINIQWRICHLKI